VAHSRFCTACSAPHGMLGIFQESAEAPMKRTWTIIGVAEVALPRGRALVSGLEEEPRVNPNTGTMEFSLRDPDGYYVTISALNAA
jgi:hypothetical protein